MTSSKNAENSLLLQQFKVKGYKNLVDTITFGPLGQINVIHGPNNVGKSNLLQAMDLYFRILNLLSGQESPSAKVTRRRDRFDKLGYRVDEVFNFVEPIPLELTGSFSLSSNQKEKLGLKKLSSTTFDIGLNISLQTDEVTIQIVHLTSGTTSEMLKRVLTFLTRVYLPQTSESRSRFVLLGVNRHLAIEDATSPSSHIVPQQLRNALFDAKESREATMVRRWELFIEAMKQFENILGLGRFETAFDRQHSQADLVFDKGNVRIPVDLLGSGIQQVVVLLGQLLLTPATLVGIEEPELNLRYTLQKQILAAFQQITESEYGPQQIFLTSHSPAFEAEETFFAMELYDGVPTLSRQPRERARIYTGTRDEEDQYTELYSRQPEPPAYVSSEGLVLLPENVRQLLKLEHGGGINFILNEATGRFEIWTTDQLDQWWSGDNSHANGSQ